MMRILLGAYFFLKSFRVLYDHESHNLGSAHISGFAYRPTGRASLISLGVAASQREISFDLSRWCCHATAAFRLAAPVLKIYSFLRSFLVIYTRVSQYFLFFFLCLLLLLLFFYVTLAYSRQGRVFSPPLSLCCDLCFGGCRSFGTKIRKFLRSRAELNPKDFFIRFVFLLEFYITIINK